MRMSMTVVLVASGLCQVVVPHEAPRELRSAAHGGRRGIPDRRILGTPYLVFGGGPMASWLAQDASALSTTGGSRSALGLGVTGGVGIAYRAFGLTLRNEFRYAQSVGGVRGSGFMPLSLGIQF